MPTYSRVVLSGSPNAGRVIPVGTTSTLIHDAIASPGLDEIYLWASNVTNADATLTVEFGGVVSPGDHLVDSLVIPANSAPIAIAEGQTLAGGLRISALSDTLNAINISGLVNRSQ